ncbi:FAD-dependent oxidoreductase [uncultured virus]|nr:FAD-dependent oxidoreductase [uncultured virus]
MAYIYYYYYRYYKENNKERDSVPIYTQQFNNEPIYIQQFNNGPIYTQQFNNEPMCTQQFNNEPIYVDDISGLNQTLMDRIFYPSNIGDIQDIIRAAKIRNKKISIRGQSHSMGGHSLTNNGILIDQSNMNKVLSINVNEKTIIVEPGLTWSELIFYLNEYRLSPKILQSYSSFSVGGSISVNAHGITSDKGMYDSIKSIKYIDRNGILLYCDRNDTIFGLIIGGYGLFGIIVECELYVVDNVTLVMEVESLSIDNFNDVYQDRLNDPNINIKLARVNILTMEEISFYKFITKHPYIISELSVESSEMSFVSQFMYKYLLPHKSFQKVRYGLEKIIGTPLDFSNQTPDRNLLLYESAKPISKLFSPFVELNKTHILQEYFIPINGFSRFMRELRLIFVNNDPGAILLNITIRFVKYDEITLLKYAKTDMYAFVFYYRIDKSSQGDNLLAIIHNRLVSITLELNGTFYLPYRHHYSNDQLIQAYPAFPDFINYKRQFDPDELFSNLWYERYS